MSHLLDAHVSAASVHFAGLVQKASLAALLPKYPDVKDEGVHRAGFYVLAGARMPAVLVETSFISNPNDEQHLNMPDYRQKLADGLVNAVRAYREGL
jgi:N-acetylmuramoyl-L-alanine amidase